LEKALKNLRRAVELGPKDAKNYFKLGEALFEKAKNTGTAALFLESRKQIEKTRELPVDREELKKDISALSEKIKAAGF